MPLRLKSPAIKMCDVFWFDAWMRVFPISLTDFIVSSIPPLGLRLLTQPRILYMSWFISLTKYSLHKFRLKYIQFYIKGND